METANSVGNEQRQNHTKPQNCMPLLGLVSNPQDIQENQIIGLSFPSLWEGEHWHSLPSTEYHLNPGMDMGRK